MSKEIGNKAEEFSINFLIDKGYKILNHNYYSKFGEIDIIASKDSYIVFIEVKFRKNINYGYPREFVNKKKQTKIKNTALCYIRENNITNLDFRFDVIEIFKNNKKIEINHLENAFC